MIFISKRIYKGSWWFNKKRKHPSIIIKSNNRDFFEIRLLSHTKYNMNDFHLKISPNPNGDGKKQYINARKYVEHSKKTFGIELKNYKLSIQDKRRFKKWKKGKKDIASGIFLNAKCYIFIVIITYHQSMSILTNTETKKR